MSSALKKISARVKQLRKKHPKSQFRTLQKQAGREYKAGKLKARRKSVAKRKAAPKKRRRVGRVARVARVARVSRVSQVATVSRVVRRPRKRRRIVARRVVRRRSVGGGGMSMKKVMPILLIGGGLVAAYLLLRKPTTVPAYIPSGNAVKDAAASNVMSWATAAGLGISALSNLIKALNASTPSQAQSLSNAASSNNSDDLNSILAELGG